MRFFPLRLPAFNSLFGVAVRRGDGCRALRRRKAVFEALSPRAMLSGHGLSGHMLSAHSPALHLNSSPGTQPAVVSPASHPLVAAVSPSPHTGAATKSQSALLHSGGGYSGGPKMFSSAGALSILASLGNYGSGTLQVTVANNYTSETPVRGGTFNLGGTTVAGIGTTNLNFGGGASLLMGGAETLTLNGGSTVTSAAPVTAGGTFNLNTGSTINGGTLLNVPATPGQPATAGSMTYGGILVNNGTLNNGTLTLGAGTLSVSPPTTTVVATGSIPGDPSGGLTLANGTLNWQPGTAVLGSGVANLVTGGTLDLATATGTTFTAGTLSLNTGSTISGTGTDMIASDGILNSGTLTLIGGPVIPISATAGFNGTYSVITSRPIAATGAGTLELAGTVSDLSNPPPSAGRVQVINNSVLDLPRPTPSVGFDSGPIIDGSSLTANHIVQGALIIDPTSPGASTVTISASDPSGNPLAGGLTPAVSLALAASAAPAPFGSTTLTTGDDSPSAAV